MAGDGSDAGLFAVPDFWQKSKWLQDLATDPRADFFALHQHGTLRLGNIKEIL